MHVRVQGESAGRRSARQPGVPGSQHGLRRQGRYHGLGLRAKPDRRILQRRVLGEQHYGYSYFVQVHDRGQPGSNDDFSVWIYDPNGAQVYTSGGLLSGGNILIHDTADVALPRRSGFMTATGMAGMSARVSFARPRPAGTPRVVHRITRVVLHCPMELDCDDNDPGFTCDSRKSCRNWLRLLGMIPLSSWSVRNEERA